jgi:Tol biopolymer transport system component
MLLADDPQQFSSWLKREHLGATVNTTRPDIFPTVSRDGLSLYFTINAGPGTFGGNDIYVSRRATTVEPWGAPQNLGPRINTASNEFAPSLTIDGHRLFFASDRDGGFGGNDIYVSRRQRTNDDFGWRLPKNLGDGVNTASNESGPELFEDDSTGLTMLYFDSNRPGGPGPFDDDGAHNGHDIYVSAGQADETFGSSALVQELSTTFVDRQPAIRRDGLEIFLTSNRPGGLGFLDLWVATRASTSDPWSTPVDNPVKNVGPPVNRAGTNDAGADLSFDGTTLYFNSGLEDPNRLDFDLFQATRVKVRGRPGQ